MTRQNNEDPAVSKGARKDAQIHRVESRGGDKGIPVEQETDQLALFSETAENPPVQASRTSVKRSRAKSGSATQEAPKSETKKRKRTETSATMGAVVSHLREAFKKVRSNRGAPGPDGKSVEYVREHLDVILPALAARRFVHARSDPARMDPKSGRRTARTWHSQRDRSNGAGSRAAGTRTLVRTNVPFIEPRVSAGTKLPYGHRRSMRSRGRGV